MLDKISEMVGRISVVASNAPGAPNALGNPHDFFKARAMLKVYLSSHGWSSLLELMDEVEPIAIERNLNLLRALVGATVEYKAYREREGF